MNQGVSANPAENRRVTDQFAIDFIALTRPCETFSSLCSVHPIMALLMVMTVCLLVYAALEYRIRIALKEQNATFPQSKGPTGAEPDSTLGISLFCRYSPVAPP
jgi:hypothetical protein